MEERARENGGLDARRNLMLVSFQIFAALIFQDSFNAREREREREYMCACVYARKRGRNEEGEREEFPDSFPELIFSKVAATAHFSPSRSPFAKKKKKRENKKGKREKERIRVNYGTMGLVYPIQRVH